MKFSHNTQEPSHLIQENWDTQAIYIWCFPIHFSAFNEKNRWFVLDQGIFFSLKHSSLWSSPITPKNHHILSKKIGIHKPFTSDVLQFVSVHSMKRTDVFFRTGYIFFTKTCRSSYHPRWNRKICHCQHKLYHKLVPMIVHYIRNNLTYQ